MHDDSVQTGDHETPERLKQFRARYEGDACGGRGRRWLKPVLLAGAVLLGLWGADVFLRGAIADSTAQRGGMSAEEWREYAVYLEGKDLPAEAMKAYEKYLETATLSDEARAKVCYSMALLAVDAGDYRDALAKLYQAELLSPDCPLKPEIDKKVVMCLEHLGRKDALRRELRHRSHVAQPAEDVAADQVVLAESGDMVLTKRDFERELEALPSSVRAGLNTAEAKGEYLRSVVARRMLVEKALRMELDRDPEILDRLEQQRNALIVEKLIDEQVAGLSEPTPEDVERFYRAELDRFTMPGSDEVPPFERVKERAAQMLQVQREQEAMARLIEQTLAEQKVTFHAERLESNDTGAAP
ncbi:MAG: hypothetical protein AMXMBFR82_41680 [Candidatus Hydrogenedentota bacterium]